jgi:hypothetical protein
MLEQAKETDETIFKQVQPYMLALMPRLTFNYFTLSMIILILWLIGLQLLAKLVPVSTANAIMFALSLLIFIYAWRFLENRNHATALFVLYTHYSRQRRDLKAQMASEVDEETLLNNLQWLEDSAQAFLEAAQENGLEPVYPGADKQK